MAPNIIYCEQQSPEWFAARLGKVTASHFAQAMMAKSASGRKTYMMKLVAERMTGQPLESYSAKWMEEGCEKEPEARIYYEGVKGVAVEQVGFVDAGDIGASPDGLIGDDGLLEIKCPFPNTHLEYILAKKLPSVYKAQVHGQLWVTERQWTDFVSYDPRVISRPFWCVRVERDEKYIKEIKTAVEQFVEELLTLVAEVSIPF